MLSGEQVRGWLMDDPEVAFPLFAKAQELGLKVVAIHKAVPLGPVPMKHYRMDDIDAAADASWPSRSSMAGWRLWRRPPGSWPATPTCT